MTAIYTCPMHPEIRSPKPGNCPRCGMALDLIESVPEEGPSPELVDMSKRFKWAAIFSLPLLLIMFSDIFPVISLEHIFSARAMHWTQLLFSLPVVLWAGLPIFYRGWQSIVNRSLNMFTLIALGTGSAFLYSLVATFFPGIFPASMQSGGATVPVYYEAAAVIMTLVLLGQVLELRARGQTGGAIRALLKLAPNTARLVRDDGSDEEVEISVIKPGDKIRIRPGESICVDGLVFSGTSFVDEAMISGESLPVEKSEGSHLIAGTVNQRGSLVMTAERVGSETLLAQIVHMVGEAQRSKAPIQKLADIVSGYFVPIVLFISLVTALVWGFFGPEPRLAYALVNAVAVLIIACPCALGLATPMSIMVGVGRGAQNGILFKNADAIESLEKVNILVVDKTGTLTEGKPTLVSIIPAQGISEAVLLSTAVALEQGSEHPLASAIINSASALKLDASSTVAKFESISGMGVVAQVDDLSCAIGNEKLMARESILIDELTAKANELRGEGQTVMFVARTGTVLGLLGIADPIKEGTPQAIELLKAEGIQVVMVTGDNLITANAVAQKLGLQDVKADALPERKAAIIKEIQAQGKRVAMAGDGINDAPALAQAQVGIAMGAGTDVAIKSAGVTLVKGDLRSIAEARKLSRGTMRNIRQNLFFAFIYNLLGVPVATGILYPFFGILLSPIIAASAMSLSSVSVIANALRLRTMRF